MISHSRVPDTLQSNKSIKINVTNLGSLQGKFFLELQSLFGAAFALSCFNIISHPAAFPSHREMLLPGLDQWVGGVVLPETHPATTWYICPFPHVLILLKTSQFLWH